MAAVDTTHGGYGQPADHAFDIEPHATEELPYVTRAIYVGGAGNLDVVMKSGEAVTFNGLLAGTILPVRAKAVVNTTTATLLVGLY